MPQAEILNILSKLIANLKKENYKGYDPYDALLSPLPWEKLGKWIPIVYLQLLKHLPINIRPILGIKKEHNPKAMGLLLHAYSILYKKTRDINYLNEAKNIFNWLINNSTQGFSGLCWGYNFPWAGKLKFVPSYSPTSVVTGFVCKGIYAYYQISGDEKAKDAIISAARFINSDIPIHTDNSGICFGYSVIKKDICYNASLLACEILAMANSFEKDAEISHKINLAVEFVLARQKPDGSWYYSEDPITGSERKQVDFHQGFILDSLQNIMNLEGNPSDSLNNAIYKGIEFYYHRQFHKNGQSLYRYPSKYPVDIHHQAQGIITFSRIKISDKTDNFNQVITEWTLNHMFNIKGYFIYRKGKLMSNKINYLRWAQAWMLLALSETL